MPHLKFACTGATLHTSYQRKDPSSGSMTLTLVPERFQTITTTAGVDLAKWEWSIQLLDTDIYSPTAEKDDYIGIAKSWPADEDRGNSCWISAVVGKSVFQRLLIAIEAGRMPSYVGVDLAGLSYGLDPDGRDKVWNTEKNETLWVKEINFNTPIGGVVVDEDGEVTPTTAPVSAAELEAFKTSLVQEMQNMTKKLYGPLWITAAVVGMIGIKMFF